MIEANQRAVLEDIVFGALSRPAMMFGVPAEGLMINVAASVPAGAWLGIGSWRELLYMAMLILVFHLIMKIGVAHDHNYLRTIKLWFETEGLNVTQWGGPSVCPLPYGMPKSAKDLPLAL